MLNSPVALIGLFSLFNRLKVSRKKLLTISKGYLKNKSPWNYCEFVRYVWYFLHLLCWFLLLLFICFLCLFHLHRHLEAIRNYSTFLLCGKNEYWWFMCQCQKEKKYTEIIEERKEMKKRMRWKSVYSLFLFLPSIIRP